MAFHKPYNQITLWKIFFCTSCIYLLAAEAAISQITYKKTNLAEDKTLKKPLGINDKSTTTSIPLTSSDTTTSPNELTLKSNLESSTALTLSLTTEENDEILKSTTSAAVGPKKILTKLKKNPSRVTTNRSTNTTELVPCTCGIFLNTQFTKGSTDPPRGEAVVSNSLDRTFACNGIGQKHCQTKCLEQIVRHLPNSANILCAALDHDIHKQRAYLFTKNCQDIWVNTNLAAGREYCCKNREPYNCKLPQ
ncbi:follicle cell protein 3C-1-like [Musca vetustissima]|uniref:follicle cell protein 3C-1-like n=1 Tax=Musca vetustissima TaxID=27455 RepID=UPI002AB632C3|nr:follicle cell protein 3C-1-like [Musca vetustissima]